MLEIYKKYLLRQGFELKEKIGSGLSGQTMKGFQSSLGRHVAIKFFDSQFNKNNQNLKKRFLRESQLLAELQHPSIPYVITCGSIPIDDGDIPYTVMQYISGITLDEYIKKHAPISLDTILHFSVQILDALSFVHEKGIVHRDIKPSNIMILPSGHCYLIDFSIGFKINPQTGMTRATQTREHLGSIQYMSPEQKQSMKNVDQKTDIYSYSLVLCELLSGKPELHSLDRIEKKCPTALKKVIEIGCSYDTRDRYSNAHEFLRELKQVSTLPFLDTPSKAICKNILCPNADWSELGYYKNVYFIEESTDVYCTSCGEKLIYQCKNCGSPIDNTRFCGGCGTQQFDVPECKQCGSYLKKNDMGKDTNKEGCEKCRNKKYQLQLQQASFPSSTTNDDVPF
ncbi:serine/threonine-protein kinase [Candidatus Parabeggiatoa sp. HSG14]|uniref:serine/threonine-protein kinase n=1 Tax=Candidatus Parabeggiatoa sp. HSG14 TaxID=3055593 RepID=UPI0025A87AC2|nr:serine/threonine-protein kinase [Thiotrichales bacterium HSG14]